MVATGGYIEIMRAVGLKVLKNKLSEYVRLAASGETVLVTDRDRVVAELAPAQNNRSPLLADALLAEAVRRYWVLGMECSLLEIQKLAWFLERAIERLTPNNNPLDLRFEANKYGPYADRLRHLLNGLDGSYLHCDKRIGDADPLDVIWFDEGRRDYLQTYLKGADAKPYTEALEATATLIDGFESPFGMELLATVDWLLVRERCEASVAGVRQGLRRWPAGVEAAERKNRLFDDRAIGIALERLTGRTQHAMAA